MSPRGENHPQLRTTRLEERGDLEISLEVGRGHWCLCSRIKNNKENATHSAWHIGGLHKSSSLSLLSLWNGYCGCHQIPSWVLRLSFPPDTGDTGCWQLISESLPEDCPVKGTDNLHPLLGSSLHSPTSWYRDRSPGYLGSPGDITEESSQLPSLAPCGIIWDFWGAYVSTTPLPSPASLTPSCAVPVGSPPATFLLMDLPHLVHFLEDFT